MQTFQYMRTLRLCSIAFLSLPWFVFFCTWLRPVWAAVFVALLAGVLARYVAHGVDGPTVNQGADALPARDRLSTRLLLIILLLAIGWVSLSGSGGVGYQNLPDWNNKNALMSDLIRFDWPVTYDGSSIINYYFALYLPASLLGRFAGWDAAQWFLYVQVIVGTVLTLLWLYSFSGKLGLAALFLFVVFGGLDIIGYFIMQHRLPHPGEGMEWWAREVQFSSNMTQMFWVPQHSLAGWLIASLMLDEAARFRRVTFAGLFAGLSLLWSPFVAIGLLPVGIAALYIAERKSIGSVSNVVFLPLISLLILAFYWPHRAGSDLDAGTSFWAHHYAFASLRRIGVFLILEVGVYLILIAAVWKSLERSWRALAIAVAISSLFWIIAPEEVGHGGFNMRTSIPSLFLLFLVLVHVLSLEKHRLVRLALAGVLVLGSGSAIQELTRSIIRYPATIPAPRPEKGVKGLRLVKQGEFLMPFDSRMYRLFFRTPS